jgi:membrane fusion protein (multidrug efflux system)
MEESFQFDIEENELTAEAVLVPRLKTVISSSRDGQIKKIHFDNGDEFKKDDVILEYHCEDLRAEIGAAQAELKFAKTKKLTTSRLFNMELASKLEREQANVEASQTDAKNKTIEQRLNDCVIRADYDGRVVKKLANDNEYTRTDRVLMEVASKGTLDVEFLLSSRALRWVNVDAPISLFLSENEREYTGKIKQIYGEVDPVSQSIQIRAGLNDYDEPLLPGMSGALTVDISRIREAGIKGFLEVQ